MNNIKTYIFPALIALVVSLGIGSYFVGKAVQSNSGDLGAVRPVADSYPSGIGIGNGTQNIVGGKITLGNAQGSWRNTTGRTVYVTDARGTTYATSTSNVGTLASSSIAFVLGTSSSATIGDYAAITTSSGGLINWAIATSTIASSTSSQGGFGSGGQRIMAVRANEYLVAAVLKVCLVTAAACENATSTNRGFNLEWSARYAYGN